MNNNNNNNTNTNILPPPENPEQLHSMLSEFMDQTEKARRLAVENTIMRCLTRPDFLFMFLQLIRMDPNAPGLRPGVRQLAAVLLRKKLLTLWRSLDHQKQQELKAILLDLLGKEPGRPERLAFAALIVVIAKVEFREGHCGWPELLQALLSACKGDNADFIELSLKIVATTAEPLMTLLRVHKSEKKKRNQNVQVVMSAEEDAALQLVRDAVANSLENGQSVKVRIAALEALNAVLAHVHGTGHLKRDILNRLLPAALNCVVQAATAKSGEGLSMALKTLEALADILELQGKAQHQFVKQAVDFLCSTAATKDLHPRLREQAVEILGDFVTNRPKVVLKNDLHTRFFGIALDLMSEDTSLSIAELSADADAEHGFGGGDNDEDDDEMIDDIDMVKIKPACVIGGRFIRVLSMELPSKVFGPLVISAASSSCGSNDPLRLKAAMVALGAAAEGCAPRLRRQLSPVMSMTTQLFSSEVPFVKEAAAFALGLFCRHLQPEISTMSDQTLPLLLSQLDDSVEAVRVSASRSLELLCETLDKKALDPFADQLLTKLMNLLTSEKNRVGPSTQYNICGVISSAMESLSQPFVNRGEDIISVLMTPLGKPINSHNDMMLRSKVMETVGVCGLAIGSERFGRFFDETWNIVRQSLDYSPSGQDVSELHESCFSFISNMARAGGDGLFGAQVEGAVKKALDVIVDESYINVKKQDVLGSKRSDTMMNNNTNDQQQQEEDDEDGDNENGGGGQVIYQNPDPEAQALAKAAAAQRKHEEDGGGAQDRWQVRIADVDMRCGAIHTIGQLAEYCPRSFSPFVDDAFEVLLDNTNHFYSGVKENALEALAHVVVSLRHEFGGENNIELFKARAPPRDTLPPKMRHYINKYITEGVLAVFTDEPERSVVAAACTGLITVVEKLGSVAVHPFAERIIVTQGIVKLLRRESSCDMDVEFESGDDTSDDDDDQNNNNDNNDDDDPEMGGDGAGTLTRRAADHDHELVDALGELIEAVVVAYGPDFAPFAQPVAQALDPYCSADRPGEDHVMAMGSLAEIAMRIGEGITPYFDRCLELALSVMENTDELIAKLNSCFMISALAKNAGHRYKPAQVQQVLASLWILLQTCKDLKQNATGGARAGLNNGREGPEAEAEFGGPEDVVRCEDNAVSAVCSLIKANCIPFGGPIEGVLDTVFELVPPRADHREIQNCITALAHLASHHAETIANHPDKANDIAVGFLKCCGKCLCASRVSAEDKTGLGICLTGTVFNGNMGYSQFFKEATNHVSPPRFANALKNIGK